MSTDIQVAFSFVSALDICLMSFGNAGTVGARNADQAYYGPLNPTSLPLKLTLCHRDLPGELTDYQGLTDYRELTEYQELTDYRELTEYQELTELKGYT
ncbi:hypothetical protein L3X38_025375 [Prunus dulcis]|uniref:Uncharacterized protein n=1 Tax=Prunus dulcis TaxID=3755 RepID=A0AAD4Z6B2_PRUDU|nr:hypothetical protein L3X38_025375 [Prunus dulcis]